MNCLDDCANDVLNYFIGKADAGVPLYMCAEDQYPTWSAERVRAAVEELEQLGLLCNCGTSSQVLKLSAGAMGDVLNGTLTAGGPQSEELGAMIQRLKVLEAADVEARASAPRAGTTGGLAPADRQPGGKGKGKDRGGDRQ